MAKNEWGNHDSDFLRALNSVYDNIRTIYFLYLLVNLFKQRYKNIGLSFFIKYYETVFTRVFCHMRVENLLKGTVPQSF